MRMQWFCSYGFTETDVLRKERGVKSMNVRRLAKFGMSVVLLSLVCGCVSAALKVGAEVVGKVVDDADTKKRAEQLIGSEPAVADQMFGQRLDKLREVDGSREWWLYPVPYDLLGKQRFVVEVSHDKIIALTKTEQGGDQLDIPRRLVLKSKVKGKSPEECEALLDFGRPVLTVRSEDTGLLTQLYGAQIIEGVGAPSYCMVKFDSANLCEDLDFVEVGASTEKKAF